ncbi:MAG: AAA family ATPase [Mangrovibacterium sp.]
MSQNKIIVLTGPESTAKSTLSSELALFFKGNCMQEYAREYLRGKSSYTYADVEIIAREQIRQYEAARRSDKLVFMDTWLIITRVWFEWVYGRVPGWLDAAIVACPVDLYLLCRPDIPWQPDPLREHGGEERNQLFLIYRDELEKRGFPYAELGGDGEERVRNARDAVQKRLGICACN